MDGGMASSLIDGRWDYGASDAAIFASIAVGIPEDGMPGFGAVMDAAQIDALVRLMREAEQRNHINPTDPPDLPPSMRIMMG